MTQLITRQTTIRHAHLFCGLGGGARGFNKAKPHIGGAHAIMKCIGGIDVDAGAVADFTRIAGVQGTQMDLFTRSQYERFHGHAPPSDWREATTADIHRAFQYERPNVVFTSPPCKGLSGLLSESAAASVKYQALNELTLRGIQLVLDAYADHPPEFLLLENVPRILNRGRHLLDQIKEMLEVYGYSSAESVHDCGELGNLAQSRKRMLLVARHRGQVPGFLYEPPKRSLRGVGEVLDLLPLPGDPRGGAMHRVPQLQFKTWTRLAFVEAGRDWRSLNKLRVVDGVLADYGIVPETPLRNGAFGVRRWEDPSGVIAGETLPTNGNFAVADPRTNNSREGSGYLGVNSWDDPMGTVTGNGRPGAGAFTVADPRADGWRDATLGVVSFDSPSGTITGSAEATTGRFSVADPRREHWGSGQLGVSAWTEPTGTITSQRSPLQGKHSVADPRLAGREKPIKIGAEEWTRASQQPQPVADPLAGSTGPRFNNVYRVVAYDQPSPAVTGQGGNSAGAVADPRGGPNQHVNGKYRITSYSEPCNTIIAGSTTGQGAFALADPRTGYGERSHQNKLAMLGWEDTARTITGATQVQGGALSIADPRPAALNANHRGEDPAQGVMYVDHYAVVGWNETSRAVTGSAKHDNGRWTVADPRLLPPNGQSQLPKPDDRLVAVIIALDGTWHRPFTTLELATLQDLIDPDDIFTLEGASDARWREKVGNAVPGAAAEAIGTVIGQALLLAWSGETFRLSDTPIWVRPYAIGIAVDQPSIAQFLN